MKSEDSTYCFDEGNIISCTRYQTPDGEYHGTLEQAKDHLTEVYRLRKAREHFDSGGTLAESLSILGQENIPPAFRRVTRNSRVKIDHWQLSEKHVYKVLKLHRWEALVGGRGGWSGMYSAKMSYLDLAGHIERDGLEDTY